MDIIRYGAPRRLLTVARGHPYERDAFAALCAGLEDFDCCHVEQPVAQRLLNPQTASEFDAILFYDMPGVDFTVAGTARPVPPEPAFVRDYLAMLDAGVGVVYLHHALAAWPAWDAYADIIGGRFLYQAAALRGRQWPDSGYRHQAAHTLSVVAEHPVTAGLPAQFAMTDELYLCPVFEEDVLPLLRSDYRFTADNFYSAARAVAGDMHSRSDWTHPPGSSLAGWAKRYGASPIVYLQGGDDAAALGNAHFRQLVHNALRWVSSPVARRWAREPG